MSVTRTALRSFTVARSLGARSTLEGALARLGFVQADPIRAPARAQDLILFQRVRGYRAGDLERRYEQLEVEEDYFINYGFLQRDHCALMHPRTPSRRWSKSGRRHADAVVEFVRARGQVHPREVDQHFRLGKVTNAWGGSSSATTHLLDGLHYRGALRVARRESGVRVYAVGAIAPSPLPPEEQLDALVDIAVAQYAPVPRSTLVALVSRLRYAAPQHAALRPAALGRALRRLASARVDGVEWFWPEGEQPGAEAAREVRLLAPFDPVVWDRRRVELLWGWTYRFEAYTPVARRRLGYYALPLLWGDQLVGWGNLALDEGGLHAQLGYLAGRPPRELAFRRALEAELERFRRFLRR